MRTSFYDFCVKQGHRALLAQWDEVRNAPLTTGNVSFGSHQKVWWQCSKGHSWQAKVYSRSEGSGCPYCTGRKETPENSLAIQVPALEAEWDAEKNAPLKFADLTVGSHKKVWWRCSAGHSYDSVVKSRVLGTGCPVCAGRVVLPDENSLAARYPALVAGWDTEKNAPLLPTLVAPGTVRKAWWRCPKGHSYRAAISSRAGGGTGCPFCAGQKVIQGENDLATQYPQLAAQWDAAKNGTLTPELVTSGSNRRVWWRCEKGHSYPAVIAHRVRSGSDCPYCSNHKVLPGFNDLATIEPVVASQWHPTRNGSLAPQQVTPGSRRKVWWLCDKGHAWRAVVNSRTGKQRCGCPICAGRPLSQCTAILSESPAEPVKISAQTAGNRGKYTCRRIIMKHKLLSILLCLAMALSLLPTAALADEGETYPAGVQDERELRYALCSAPTDGTQVTIKLTDDIVLEKLYAAENFGTETLADNAEGDTYNRYKMGIHPSENDPDHWNPLVTSQTDEEKTAYGAYYHMNANDERIARLVVKSGQNVVLDLNGYTIQKADRATHGDWSNTCTDIIGNYGTLTITDTSTGEKGTIKGIGYISCQGAVLHNYTGATLTVGAVNVDGNAAGMTAGTGQYVIRNEGGSVTINGTSVFDTATSASLLCNDSGTMKVTGNATLNHPATKTVNVKGGTVEIENAAITSDAYAIYAAGGTAKINGAVTVTGNGTLAIDADKGGAIKKAENVSLPAPEGTQWVKNGDVEVLVNTTDVAVVDGKGYATLAEAITAAPRKATVTLLADTRENVTISTPYVTLDLNGHTLNGGTEKGKPALTITARVTVMDSSEAQTGTIMREDTAENSGVSSHYVIDIQGGGWLTFESGNVENNSGNTEGKGASLVRVGDDSVAKYPGLNIKGGTFTQDNFIVIKVDRGDLFLNGGTLNSANSYAVENWLRATIRGGTVNGTVSSWVYSTGTAFSELEISGGKINGNVASVNYDNAADKQARIYVTGGTVNGTLGTYTYSNGLVPTEETAKATIEVTGGTFSNDPTKYVVEDSAVTKNEDNTFGVAKAYLAKVGETSYYTMDEAFKAQTASGKPIVLLRDYTTGSTFNSGTVARTVDLNGHTWTCTGTDANSAAFEINYANASLTVKNGKIVSSQLVGLIPSASGGTIKYDNSSLTFENVEMSTTTTSGIETNGNNTNDSVTLRNSTLNVPNGFGIYFPSSGTLTIDNSTINAKTMGVQVCAGNLNINDGSKITVTGDAVPKTEGDGAIQDGAAISIVNRTGYKGLGEIAVTGGTFTAKSGNAAIKAYDWQNQTESNFTASDKVSVSGGMFSSAVKPEYCAPGFVPKANSDGTYGVTRPSSGGSSSYDPTYSVSTPSKTEHGTVIVSPKSASKGDTVTVTVKPDSGYVLETLTVTDKNGNELTLKDKGNGKYTFTMPASKVEIKATFVKEVETSPFSDVSTNAYYYEAVKWAQEKGITGGIGNGLFGPNQPCTRAQIVTFLWRAAGSPEPKAMSSFSDVSADSYYAKAVAWAVENGITTGTGDGKFSPDATCTRAQSVTFLYRAIGKLVDSKAEFSDVLTDSYYANAVAWAVENGVTNGIGDGLFGPDNSCTRAQIVTFLFRAYQGK